MFTLNTQSTNLDLLRWAREQKKQLHRWRLGLRYLHVSNLPKSNIFILDEPGTALDAENLEGFVRILDMVKVVF